MGVNVQENRFHAVSALNVCTSPAPGLEAPRSDIPAKEQVLLDGLRTPFPVKAPADPAQVRPETTAVGQLHDQQPCAQSIPRGVI